VHPLATALASAQSLGIRIDVKARAELSEHVKARLAVTKSELDKTTGKDFNPNSPKQVKELLYDTMHLPSIYKKKAGVTTIVVDEEALLKLFQQYPDEPCLKLILAYRKDSKLLSTFLDIPLDANNRVYTSYNASGTVYFRISSSQDMWKEGINLQNIPVGKKPGVENIRYIFIADDGWELTKGDLVQAEAMVVSRILCRYGDRYVWTRYSTEPEFDIHKWAASTIFSTSEDLITKHQRNVGKIRVHSGNYVAGPPTIMSTALKYGVDGIDYRMAKQIVDSGHISQPGLKKWWSDVERTIQRTRTLYTCLGRRCIFFDRADSSTNIRSAVSFEPQSTVGDVCNTIFRRLSSKFIELGLQARCVLQVHDEVVIHHPKSEHDIVKKLFQEAAIVPLNLNKDIEPLIIPVEIKSGANWRDCS
jgi:DNA polymerase-1